MEQYTLRYFFNGFYRFRWGALEELRSWIMVCAEEGVPYTVFDPNNNIIEEGKGEVE